jgi:YggT family protein
VFAGIMLVAILIRIVFSWTGFDPANPIYGVINEVTEPILQPIRNIIPRMGMFDLSPMIASFILFFLLQLGLRLASGE